MLQIKKYLSIEHTKKLSFFLITIVIFLGVLELSGRSRPDDERAPNHIKEYVSFGAGPRGSQNLVLAAKAHALLDGRTAPTEEDVRSVAVPILRHRIIINHRAVGDGVTSEDVVQQLL